MDTPTRHATEHDLPAVAAIYAHYVRNTPATFDLEPPPVETWRARYDAEVAGGSHHLLVAERGGEVVGWCETGRFRERRAYDSSCTVSVYVHHDAVGSGVGSALYRRLFEELAGGPFHRAYAGITQPNEASMTLHKRFGFAECGLFREVGRKFDRWWDVAWLEKPL